MKQNMELPEWCRIIDRLISEIAKQRGQEPEEIEETLLRKIDEEGNEK